MAARTNKRVTMNGEAPAEGEELEDRLNAFNSGHYVRACGWSKVDIVKNMLPDNID